MKQKTAIISAYEVEGMQIPEHKLAFLDWNDTATNTIICIHGLISNAHDFDFLAEKLSNNFRIIAIDIPGRGNSEWFQDKNLYQYSVYIADVLALLKSLNITSVDWIGTSMGGIMGMMIAASHPSIIKSLILNDIGPEIPGKALAKMRKYVGISPNFLDFDTAKKHLQLIYKNFGITQNEHWDHLTKHTTFKGDDGIYRLKYDLQIAETFIVDLINPQDIIFWDLWDKITCNILLIHGERSDILLSSTVDQMKQRPKTSIYLIKGAGHAPALVGKEEIDYINEWLTSF